MTEDEMVEWHHQLDGHEFEQALGDGEGQGSLVCCSPWGRKESDATERLNNNNNIELWIEENTYSYINVQVNSAFGGGVMYVVFCLFFLN